MPNLTGPQVVLSGATDLNSASPGHRVLSKAYDVNGNEYVLLGGVASTAIGTPVTFDENGSTTVLAANAVGPVAVAMAAVTSASNYGWYQIYGNGYALIGDGVSADAQLYISGTTGYVSDTDISTEAIIGMVSLAANAVAGGTVQVFLNRPYVANAAID